MLKETYIELLRKYKTDDELIKKLWYEIEKNYSDTNRYYHTLLHLEELLDQLSGIKAKIIHWDAVLFALYYHDVIYNPSRKDNEEQSAKMAESRMEQISVPKHIVEKSAGLILATKKHNSLIDTDNNYFTDADLAILGQDWVIYSNYCKNVRKEYSEYSTQSYNSGRKAVLNHFLGMERIYKTDYFYTKFEQQARQNMQKELEKIVW